MNTKLVTKGRVIIIGASSGIGEGLVREYAKKGYDVGLLSRRVDLMKTIVDSLKLELKNKYNTKFFIKKLDLYNIDEAMNVLNSLIEEMSDIDIIIMNSGIGYTNKELDWDKEGNTIKINVLGFTAMMNIAAKYLLKRTNGNLVAISSIAGLRGNEAAPAYGASKAYNISYIHALRHMFYKKSGKVKVTDIRPGYVDTPMVAGQTQMFWVSSVEKACKQIYKAVAKGKPHVYITKRWKLIAMLIKILPFCLYKKS